MKNFMPFCECRKGIYEIDEYGCSEIFVIVGTKRALVIDTGTGIGDLKGLIESRITDKPYDVAASHNHVDHIGGAGWFEKIYMHPADIGNVDPFFPPTLEFRKKYAQIIKENGTGEWDYSEQDIRPWPASPEFIPMEDGYVFDLGGRTVTAYHCPGHTAGEMVFIDSLTRTLLCGDAFNCNWLFDSSKVGEPYENVKLALEAMKRLYNMRDQYDVVYNSHHDFRPFGEPLSSDVITELIECMEQIWNKNAHYRNCNYNTKSAFSSLVLVSQENQTFLFIFKKNFWPQVGDRELNLTVSINSGINTSYSFAPSYPFLNKTQCKQM